MSNSESNPTQRVIDQRVRNRVIEYLEWASSEQHQREYQAAAPINVANEIFNQWEDWVRDETIDRFASPVFSISELAAIRRFHLAWNLSADETPDVMPELHDFIGTPPWQRLRSAAESALQAFCLRGRFDEETEDPRVES